MKRRKINKSKIFLIIAIILIIGVVFNVISIKTNSFISLSRGMSGEKYKAGQEGFITITYTSDGKGTIKTVDESVEKQQDECLPENVTGAKAVANATYFEFVGWENSSGTIVSTDAVFVPSGELLVDGATYKATFKDTRARIYYNTQGTGYIKTLDGKTNKSEDIIENSDEEIGVLAVQYNTDTKFMFWQDASGNVLTYSDIFIPTEEQKVAGSTYTAVFSTGMYFTVNDDTLGQVGLVSGGYVGTGTNDYTNKIMGITSSYVAVRNKGENKYNLFDYLEVDGVVIAHQTLNGPGYRPNALPSGSKIFKAYFKPTNTTGTIKYGKNGEGLITNSTDYIANGYEIKGSTAVSTSVWKFIRWEDENGDTYSTNETIVPSASASGKTFTAVFDKVITINYTSDGNGTVKTPDEAKEKSQEKNIPSELTGVKAVANEDYFEFVGWENESGTIVSTNATFVPTGELAVDGATYKATFKDTRPRIYYTIEGAGTVKKLDGKSNKTEDLIEESEEIGALAVQINDSNKFFFWKDEDGNILTYDEKFIPTGNQIKAGAKYTAVFSTGMYFTVNDDTLGQVGLVSGGYVGSGANDYTNKIMGITSSYVAVRNKGENKYNLFDYLEVDGVVIAHQTLNGPGYRPSELPSGSKIFKAYFKPANTTGTIKYEAKDGKGNITNTTDYIANGYEIKGSSAISNSESRFVRWENEDGSLYSNNPTITPIASDAGKTFVAVFENRITINYSADGNGKIKTVDGASEKSKDYAFESEVTGVKAVPDGNNIFVAWKDSDGKIVSTNATFVPSGNMVSDGATYTAVFSDGSSKIAVYLINIDSANGAIARTASGSITDDLTNTVGGLFNGTIKGVSHDTSKYTYDFLAVNNQIYSKNSIHPKSEITDELDGKPTIIEAYFKPTTATGAIYYTVENKGSTKGKLSNQVDYIESGKELAGSTAIVPDGSEFVEWQIDGDFYSNELTINPDSSYNGKTFTAVFKDTAQVKLMYNINLLDVSEDDITWTTLDGTEIDINDYFEGTTTATSLGCVRYVDKNQYLSKGDEVTLLNIIPRVDGYMFAGWFDKKRDEQEATIRTPADAEKGVNPYSSNKQTYSLDAVWFKWEAVDVVDDYTGIKEHTTTEFTITKDTSVFKQIQELNPENADKDYLSQLEDLETPNIVKKYKKATTDPNYATSGYSEDEPPTYKDAGEYIVEFQITTTILNAIYSMEGTANVTVNKIPVKIVPETQESIYGDDISLTKLVKYYLLDSSGNYYESELPGDDEDLEFSITTTATNRSDIGEYPITISNYANKEKNKNYDITVEEGTYTITPRPVTIKVVPETTTRYYGEDNPDYDVEMTGVLTGEKSKIDYTLGNIPDKYADIGNYTITVSADENQGNYKIVELINADLIIQTYNREDSEIKAEDYIGTYDGAKHSITVTGITEHDKVEYSLDNSTWTETKPDFKNITDGTVVYVKVKNPNTNPEEVIVSAKVTINPITVTVVADDKVAKYNEDIPELTAVVTGVLEGESINYSLSTPAQKGSDSGTYDINVLAESTQGNYIVEYTNAKLTIDPLARDDIEVESYVGKYDGKNHTITVKGTIDGDVVQYSLDGENWTSVIPTYKNIVSAVPVYVRVTNVNSTPKVINKTGTVTITPLEVTITADDKTVQYNEAIPDLTSAVTGNISGDKIEYSVSTTAIKGSDVGDYPITITAESIQGNYIVSVVDATLTIKPIDREIKIISYEGIYDGESHTISVNGIIEGDKIEYSLDGKTWITTIPKFTDIINNAEVFVKVTNSNVSKKENIVKGTVTIRDVAKEEDSSKTEQSQDNSSDNQTTVESESPSETTEETKESTNVKTKSNTNPVTGDKIIIYVVVFFISLGVLVIIIKHRK